MATEAYSPSDSPSQPRRRDAAGVVLSGVTAVVLLVGVLVIRSTRSDHPTPPPVPEPAATAEANASEAPQPEIMIAWPKNRDAVLR